MRCYRVANHDHLAPFFVTVVSSADHWLFASSRGGLSAGRKDPEGALFPYTTDDRVHDSSGITGSMTLMHVTRRGHTTTWEPFNLATAGPNLVERNLYKSVVGDRLAYEERHQDLQLTFRYWWCTSRRFGFVRRTTLENNGQEAVQVRLLDGVANLLPSGVEGRMQTDYSTLVDAYKRSEFLAEARLAVFRLASIPVDRAEPSEALRATVAWLDGLDQAECLLSSNQVEAFRRGEQAHAEEEVRGTRQAFLAAAELDLSAGATESWSIIADVGLDAASIEELLVRLPSDRKLSRELEQDIQSGTDELRDLVAAADGLQSCGRPLEDVSHFSNTLFNVMRGGIFVHGYAIPTRHLRNHIEHAAPRLAAQHADALERLPEWVNLAELRSFVEGQSDDDLVRVARGYLPLHFSRRHGDPSRPWNTFSIETRDDEGQPTLKYQGNWRDIFQNWEALCVSYPLFTESVIARFVNASTADGYNPYRLTSRGFEWEILDPEDPWSNIGYWGDHQVVYLGRLLATAQRHLPGLLGRLLTKRQFTYAEVPYRIRPYAALLTDPQDTIEYDSANAAEVLNRVEHEGQEGKLVRTRSGEVHRVGLGEKLLLPVLVKLANLVPELGIWMNTQRPEWNDANNALVGNGCSVVTLCQVRRYLELLTEILGDAPQPAIPVSTEVFSLAQAIDCAFEQHEALLQGPLTPANRRTLMDALGKAGEEHRRDVYRGFEGTTVPLTTEWILSLSGRAQRWVEHSILANRRNDGLYHAYNLLKLEESGGVDVQRLDVMLEGQVAILGSGILAPLEALAVLKSLRASDLYCPEQDSYLLYPDRPRPRFLERNEVPLDLLQPGSLLHLLVDAGDTTIAAPGPGGVVRFAPELRNGAALQAALEALPTGPWTDLVERDCQAVLRGYEEVFQHSSFTGRSGSFYGYEGLGCVYWHQVSKLLLATLETLRMAVFEGVEDQILRDLAALYRDIRAGLGTNKPPARHGAFPTDPYSHTPRQGGAQQPGMTGQAKEDFLARLGELGVWTSRGSIHFHPVLLDPADWQAEPTTFRHVALDGEHVEFELAAGQVAFTLCQVPVVLCRADSPEVRVRYTDGQERRLPGCELDARSSSELFGRTGRIERVTVLWAGEPLLGPSG